MITDKIGMPGDGCLGSTSCLGLVIIGVVEGHVGFLGVANHGLSQRVYGVCINGSGDAKDVDCGRTIKGNHV